MQRKSLVLLIAICLWNLSACAEPTAQPQPPAPAPNISPVASEPTPAPTNPPPPTVTATPAPSATSEVDEPSETATAGDEETIVSPPDFVAPTADPTLIRTPLPPPEGQFSVALSVRDTFAANQLDQSAYVVAVTGLEGSYASGVIARFGALQQVFYAQLQTDRWEIVFTGTEPDPALLTSVGFPAEMLELTPANGFASAWMAQLNDPRGSGSNGIILLEGLVGNYARGLFIPADLSDADPVTAFFRRNSAGTWEQLTAGTAFGPDLLSELGIPQELWRVE